LTQAITATCQNSEGSGWLYRLLGNLSGKKHLLVVDGHTNHTQMSNIGPHGVCGVSFLDTRLHSLGELSFLLGLTDAVSQACLSQ